MTFDLETTDLSQLEAVMETDKGTMTLRFFSDLAPKTVRNFLKLAQDGFYDGLVFHRIIKDFMVQGGCPKGTGTGGPGYNIDCECYREDARLHFRGSLSMAHAGRDSGGSQFFITHQPTPHLNAHPRPESVHTVFGRVLTGTDVVGQIQKGDEIVSAVVQRKRNHEYKPKVNDKSSGAN